MFRVQLIIVNRIRMVEKLNQHTYTHHNKIFTTFYPSVMASKVNVKKGREVRNAMHIIVASIVTMLFIPSCGKRVLSPQKSMVKRCEIQGGG